MRFQVNLDTVCTLIGPFLQIIASYHSGAPCHVPIWCCAQDIVSVRFFVPGMITMAHSTSVSYEYERKIHRCKAEMMQSVRPKRLISPWIFLQRIPCNISQCSIAELKRDTRLELGTQLKERYSMCTLEKDVRIPYLFQKKSDKRLKLSFSKSYTKNVFW